MKLFFASDLHGSLPAAEKLIDAYEKSGASRLVLLGDLLYHGPRNPLPAGYDPPRVADRLNDLRNEILCVRGNCDSEVDQMMLRFPLLADYAMICIDDVCLMLTHGHHLDDAQMPLLRPTDVLIHGHTHIPRADHCGPNIVLNPGSVALPKNSFPASYMTYADSSFVIQTLDGGLLMQQSIRA